MKDVSEFMKKMVEYYGAFINEKVADLIAEELHYIKPTDYDRVFRFMIEEFPANWKPDIKAINDIIKKNGIQRLSNSGGKKCPVCFTINYSSCMCCPKCKYESNDGSPEVYRQFWKDWQAGKVKRFDSKKLIQLLAESKKYKEEEEEKESLKQMLSKVKEG